MEFPHLGDQCDEPNCRQLDFLPVKCDGCKSKFCAQHWTYEGHKCTSPRLKDVQVPVCPLCDKPVPSKPGAVPDEAVSRHLDGGCQANRKRNPRCSKAKCKVRELIKVDCNQCSLNFCLKHRHPQVSTYIYILLDFRKKKICKVSYILFIISAIFTFLLCSMIFQSTHDKYKTKEFKMLYSAKLKETK